MKSPRAYRMSARAAATEETGRRVIEAMQQLFAERAFETITLEAVAERAGVTLQTVLRRFGSKAGLVAAAAAEGMQQVEAQRFAAPVGDVKRAVKNLFDHYEEQGPVALKLLSTGERFEEIGSLARKGQRLHQRWVKQTFAPQLAARRGSARARLEDALICACDVYVWKLLRHDLGRSRAQAELTVAELIKALCARREA